MGAGRLHAETRVNNPPADGETGRGWGQERPSPSRRPQPLQWPAHRPPPRRVKSRNGARPGVEALTVRGGGGARLGTRRPGASGGRRRLLHAGGVTTRDGSPEQLLTMTVVQLPKPQHLQPPFDGVMPQKQRNDELSTDLYLRRPRGDGEG